MRETSFGIMKHGGDKLEETLSLCRKLKGGDKEKEKKIPKIKNKRNNNHHLISNDYFKALC